MTRGMAPAPSHMAVAGTARHSCGFREQGSPLCSPNRLSADTWFWHDFPRAYHVMRGKVWLEKQGEHSLPSSEPCILEPWPLWRGCRGETPTPGMAPPSGSPAAPGSYAPKEGLLSTFPLGFPPTDRLPWDLMWVIDASGMPRAR